MGWSEIIKAVNSNISVPLNKLITSAKDSLNAAITNVKSGVDASITSAKNELSTLIKKNGTSYPNVTNGMISPNEQIAVNGRGKIMVRPNTSSGVYAECTLDNLQLASNFTIISGGYQTLTFEKSILLKNTSSNTQYKVFYLLQLTE